jgi:acetoin utilization deacetylase AcuC-like enzyme
MAAIVFSPRYHIDIGQHVFPTKKYPLIRQALLDRRMAAARDFLAPEPASWDDLALVHTDDYLQALREGTLSADEQAQLEVDASPGVVEGFRLMTGGTVMAARVALEGRKGLRPRPGREGSPDETSTRWQTRDLGIHLGGGFHHACEDHGEGFCLFHDVAVAVRVLKREGAVRRAAIIDCDVHHGNGTAFIFAGERSVFTFSMHQEHNYPSFKPASSLDIHLPDYADDEMYLRQLAGALPRIFASGPDVAFYLAGADPYTHDQLGGLALTKEGLRRRDRLVFNAARELGVPLVVTLAGGYARDVNDTVEIHANTIEDAIRTFGNDERRPFGEAQGRPERPVEGRTTDDERN